LWKPVEGQHSTHGDFDAHARCFSPQLWTREHCGWFALAGLALAAGILTLYREKGMNLPLQQPVFTK
jgi:hypothetical protein